MMFGAKKCVRLIMAQSSAKKEVTYNGCGNHSCLVKKPKGQGTNAGCMCYRDNKRARKAIIYQAQKIKDLESAIYDVVRHFTDGNINLTDKRMEMIINGDIDLVIDQLENE